MFGFIRMTCKWFGIEVDLGNEDGISQILMFLDEGNPVLLCDDVEVAVDLFGKDNIEMVT